MESYTSVIPKPVGHNLIVGGSWTDKPIADKENVLKKQKLSGTCMFSCKEVNLPWSTSESRPSDGHQHKGWPSNHQTQPTFAKEVPLFQAGKENVWSPMESTTEPLE